MHKLTENNKIGSNKSFGIVFFIIFLLIAIFPLLHTDNIRIWSIIVSLIFLFLAFMKPKILSPLNYLWFKFGNLIGVIVSPLIMGIIFFAVVTPIGLFMRIIGKDLLKTSFDNRSSYWISRIKKLNSMKKQF